MTDKEADQIQRKYDEIMAEAVRQPGVAAAMAVHDRVERVQLGYASDMYATKAATATNAFASQ